VAVNGRSIVYETTMEMEMRIPADPGDCGHVVYCSGIGASPPVGIL
jgi:hypothetical protein